MVVHRYKVLVLFLFISLNIIAQTTNIGEVAILPNTQVGIMDDFNNTTTASVMNDGELFVYSNFNNDGLFSFFSVSNNGLTRFEGETVQQITGNALTEFYDVLFNNPSPTFAFELKGDISIVNVADFYQGIVKNDDFGGTITFEQYSDHTNTSNISHVDGLVYKAGDVSFEFPIGDAGYYRSAIISMPENKDDVFSSKYFFENSNGIYPHNMASGVIELIDNAEYWTLTRENGSSTVLLTLSWDDNTTPSIITAIPATAIHIVRWDDVRGFWVDEGGIVDEVNQTVTTITELEDYGVFTLARVKEDMISPDDLVIYNSVSPNGDGGNDFFFIDGISRYPDNTVQIFNRWGVKVFETSGYNESDNVFRGISEGRITINKNKQLPTGTYFYTIKYVINRDGQQQLVKKAGYLYIDRDSN